MRIIYILFWTLVVLNIADLSLTYSILLLGGGEANPVAYYFIQQLGALPGMLLIKAPTLVILGYLVYNYEDARQEWVAWLMGIVSGVYLGVIGYSIYVLRVLMEIQ